VINIIIVVDMDDSFEEVGMGSGETQEIALERAYASVNGTGEALINEYGCRFVSYSR